MNNIKNIYKNICTNYYTFVSTKIVAYEYKDTK